MQSNHTDINYKLLFIYILIIMFNVLSVLKIIIIYIYIKYNMSTFLIDFWYLNVFELKISHYFIDIYNRPVHTFF